MAIDTEQLRKHYASLSDEALEEVKRDDLVEAAQQVYDDEVAQRERAKPRLSEDESQVLETPDDLDAEGKPAWLPDAAQVFTQVEHARLWAGQYAERARDALEAAGIPCFLETTEVEEPASPASQWKEWRLFVPGNLNQRAMSVIERDIDNPTFEEQWKTHLEDLSDRDLRAMDPKSVYCGLFDRIERITRVYNAELARRQSK